MSDQENFRERIYLVADPDARIRVTGDLQKYARYQAGEPLPPGATVGDYKRIPKGTRVRVNEIAYGQSGSHSHIVFARVADKSNATEYGWTSSRNFQGKFRNTTLGLITPKPGAGRYSDTAAWRRGDYLGQVSLVPIVDETHRVETLTEKTVGPYFEMVDAADRDGVEITINSGFRSYPAQKFLYQGYVSGQPGFNLAARPGYSNHQNGIALDIEVAGSDDSPEYLWLAENATAFGFVRTVKKEPWHWEYRPDEARKAREAGQHSA